MEAITDPDFVVPICGYMGPVPKVNVRVDGPPVFLAAAIDDQPRFARERTKFYDDWIFAGKSAEIHIYANGGYGFGMRKQNIPSDHRISRFGNWLQSMGWMKKEN